VHVPHLLGVTELLRVGAGDLVELNETVWEADWVGLAVLVLLAMLDVDADTDVDVDADTDDDGLLVRDVDANIGAD
jgi:hypothetical protein